MSSTENGVHILIFPYPAQGHMLPLLDLAHHLSRRTLSITILITPKNLPILSALLSANPSIQTLILPFPSHPSIPPGVENLKDLGNHGNIPMMSALSKLHDPIIQWFASHPNPPVAILSDFFLGWTHRLARQLSVPRVVFFASGAFAVDILNYLWANLEDVEIGSEIELRDVPGSPRLAWAHVPSVFRSYRESVFGDDSYDGDVDLITTSMVANYSSWASVTNTFAALEDEFLGHMSELMGHQRVFSVGPLNMLGRHDNLRGSNVDDDKDGVISWLDRWEEDGSVLYVCFGSQKLLNKAQTEALAVGLERSGVRFVWVAKSRVPDGFEGRVLDRGFIVEGWAPQTSILGHRAVGGFLSHCGWNSVLEAMVGGVMILGWPMEADQFLNAKLLVEYKGAAVVVCEGGETVPDSVELAQKIGESMVRGDGKERVRAVELRDEALEAIKVGGSSNRDLDGLVQELSKLKANNV